MAGLNERVFRSNKRPVRAFRGVTIDATLDSKFRGVDDNDAGDMGGTCFRGVDDDDDAEDKCWTTGLNELCSLELPSNPRSIEGVSIVSDGVKIPNGGGPVTCAE